MHGEEDRIVPLHHGVEVARVGMAAERQRAESAAGGRHRRRLALQGIGSLPGLPCLMRGRLTRIPQLWDTDRKEYESRVLTFIAKHIK
eukprot:748195-Hanusia_phi.AAC.2